MNINTHFRHVSHSEELDSQIESWLSSHFNLATGRNLKIEVFISKTAPRTEAHGAVFECHMTANAPWLRRSVFSKISDSDFWTAFTVCAKKLQQQIDKDRSR